MTIGSSMSFDPAHARIRKRATKQLKQNTAEQLEQETRRMEERVRTLKEQMVKEKEEREKYGGTRWSSGKSISSQQAPKKKSSKSEKGPRKITILSDEPLSSYTSKKTVLRESINESFSGPCCGQCDKAKATLACNECTESYCVGCFMSFHKKGALRTHTTRNLDQYEHGLLEEKEKLTSRVPKTDDRSRARVSHGRTSQNSSSPEQKTGGALWKGTFSEEESSASFAQALNEWRSTKNKDSTWVNPSDSHPAKAKTASCETSTGPEKLTQIDMNLNFGANKSLTYLDRLVLKKHREDPNSPRPMSRSKGKKAPGKRDEPAMADEEYGINYREIFQTLGAQTSRGKSPLNGYDRYSSPLKDITSAVTIKEVSESIPSEEATCIVEEGGDAGSPGQKWPTSRTCCVSIMGMTATGDFRADVDNLQAASPVFAREATGAMSQSSGMHKPRRDPITRRIQSASARVWSPKPGYTGLSNFFLVGVDSESPRGTPRADPAFRRTPSPSKRVSPKLLARKVWKPEESVCVMEVSCQADTDDNKYPGGRPVIPLVQEPSDSEDTSTDSSSISASRRKAKEEAREGVEHMNDFGIVDFLKASPIPRKSSEDYYDVHRVSTVSPLSLTPNPPQLHWSDDESDDDVVLEVTSRASMLEVVQMEESEKDDQEEDDKATLEDLTWELESTTGRLTHCEGDLDEYLDQDVGESCELDSIEDDLDSGSTCSLKDDHAMSINSSDSMDEEEMLIESRMMEQEVQALE